MASSFYSNNFEELVLKKIESSISGKTCDKNLPILVQYNTGKQESEQI